LTKPEHFLHFNALGLAILRSCDPSAVADLLPEGERHEPPRRSVVLIDEVDKAPRDFPNDLLNEIEGMSFTIPELAGRFVQAGPHFPPVVIITSNSEKDLPDPFLRRCAFYNIPFPDPGRLRAILSKRIGDTLPPAPFLDEMLAAFQVLRSPSSGLRKPPSTAELLNWASAVITRSEGTPSAFTGEQPALLSTLSAVVKNPDDQRSGSELLARWLKDRPKKA
jgi:MoxR-like ATPase